ncbi:MAG TPA: PTS system mannose/fructose/sorbose family transporter subunit IID, partial [Candidatus Goldiibacteriota bacterium]|nr:PTS system mannose/fructose/sorbose family transporter subunit IID [Candidatus Goldiibacteriota bacterium]
NILKRIYGNDRDNLQRAVKRHMGFFNTHIFFSSAVLGAVARCEKEIPNSDTEAKDREIDAVKMGIMGPLAAIGDALFWSGLKPFALLAGVVTVMLGGNTPSSLAAAAAVSLVVFNLPRVVIKYYLLFKSYYDFDRLFESIRQVKFQEIMKSIRLMGMGMLGGTMAVFLYSKDLNIVNQRLPDSVLLSLVFGVMAFAIRRKVSVSHLFTGVVIISVLLSYIR